ncbi:GCN5 family acetyltransferase [Vibrio neptunius]|uniref:GNAT family N-acetyltransferase n=1 Tax=Vibrio neptunius TaxID=170651 RepID=UPI0005F9E666|nr:GNAT family N-acetyltransferase [Vibrio neptunius]KJY91436.1 GCN5 family acetyltransferase [Vibrio neptunius]
MKIRTALRRDVQAITDIFNYYIAHTNARFEETSFTLENRLNWFEQFSPITKHQLLVAEHQGNIVGFACSQPYRSSEAFADTVEVTIYLVPDAKEQGTGSALYQALMKALKLQGVHRALSGIALPNEASIALHEKFGFREVGVFDSYAKKNGSYISSVWLEKLFG